MSFIPTSASKAVPDVPSSDGSASTTLIFVKRRMFSRNFALGQIQMGRFGQTDFISKKNSERDHVVIAQSGVRSRRKSGAQAGPR
jgi:hypothetical protein